MPDNLDGKIFGETKNKWLLHETGWWTVKKCIRLIEINDDLWHQIRLELEI